MRKIIITIPVILLAFYFYAVAQKNNAAEENIPKEVPDIVVIEQLSDQYSPVRFKHKLHSQPMAVMGIECSDCHHYSPPDSFPPCMQCHSQTRTEINSKFPLNRPSLEGAYHRKCVNCHREWSDDIIECSVCHTKKVAGETVGFKSDVTEDVDWDHPVMEPEDKKVYNTDYHGGQIVTFFHKEHSELFEIDCLNCHREGNCSLCHGQEEPKEDVKSQLEIHKSCVSCHTLEDNCQQCHTNTENQGFDHGQRTGWPLKQYHVELSCHRCHIPKGEFSELDTGCDVCHRGWNPQNFNHSVTGIVLDDNHREIDCEYCHPKGKFDKEVSCSDCHGEDIKYPNDLPGPSPTEM